MQNIFFRRLRPVLMAAGVLLSFYSIGGCAMGTDEKVLYSVEFDTRFGNQNSTVLDYKYMRGSQVLMAPFPEELNGGKGMFASGQAQWMPHGTSLYVKWRDNDTGMVHEDTVNLQGALPPDLSRKAIHLTFKGAQLSIYVIFSSEPSDVPLAEQPFFAKAVRSLKIYPK